MKERDERLRDQAEQEQSKLQASLAIPSNKELFVQTLDYKEFSKAHVRGEQKFRQKNFDEMRMNQLANSLIAMRQIEKSKE